MNRLSNQDRSSQIDPSLRPTRLYSMTFNRLGTGTFVGDGDSPTRETEAGCHRRNRHFERWNRELTNQVRHKTRPAAPHALVLITAGRPSAINVIIPGKSNRQSPNREPRTVRTHYKSPIPLNSRLWTRSGLIRLPKSFIWGRFWGPKPTYDAIAQLIQLVMRLAWRRVVRRSISGAGGGEGKLAGRKNAFNFRHAYIFCTREKFACVFKKFL